MIATKPGSRRHAPQRGSAYLVTLLALVVLTIVGLSLAAVTQTEMQIGANERTLQRVFYAADSGISAATARAIVTFSYAPRTYELKDDDTPAALNLRQVVEVSPFLPLLSSPCNLCEINRAGQYGSQNYYRVNHGVSVTATRRGGGDEVLARKELSAMVDVQPWRPAPEAYRAIDNVSGGDGPTPTF